MIFRTVRWLLCACVAAVLIAPSTAFAYTVGGGSSAGGPASIAAGTAFLFSSHFVDGSGDPIVGATVTFSQQSGPTAFVAPATLTIAGREQAISLVASTCVASFDPVTTTTNSGGVANTTVTLPSGCPGQYVLAATLSGGGTVTFTTVETGGFPNTTADPPAALPWWFAPLLVVVVSLSAAAGLRLWSVRHGRWS